MSRPPVLVLGVGNPDRRDDGIGPAVVAALAGRLPAGVEARCGCRDVADLLEAMAGRAALVAIDAAIGPALAPGAVRVLDPAEAALPAPRPDPSGHALGLAAALAFADALGEAPGTVRILAVGVLDLRPGAGLSPPVAAAVAHAAGTVLQLLNGRLRPLVP